MLTCTPLMCVVNVFWAHGQLTVPVTACKLTFRPYESDVPSMLAAPLPAEHAELPPTMLIVSTSAPVRAAELGVHAV